MALHDHISKDELDALNDRFAAEDEKAETDPEVAESERTVSSHNAFAEHGVEPREIDGVTYSEFE